MIELEKLLAQIGFINQKYREIDQLTGNRFNIFNILKLGNKEVKLHSAFIAELLNPLGIHDMGLLFLNSFITQLRNIDKLKKINFLPSVKTVVKVEFHIGSKTDTDGGRIDIVLVDESGYNLIIENKIHASDQENQLVRYDNYKVKDKSILYLTLFGEKPTIKSSGEDLEENVNFDCISYREFILDWLDTCYKTSISHPKLRETILQYINTIKELTGLSMSNLEERKSIYNAVGKTTENTLAAIELIKNWEHVKWHTEWDFWNELFASISNKISLSFTKDYSAEQLNAAIHRKKNKNPYYGISAFIKDVKHLEKTLEIYLVLQRGFGNLFYGIMVLEKGMDDIEENYFNVRLKHEDNIFFKECEVNEGKWWSYRKEASTSINFHYFGDEDTIKLINPKYRTNKINSLIDELQEFLLEFEKDEVIVIEKV